MLYLQATPCSRNPPTDMLLSPCRLPRGISKHWDLFLPRPLEPPVLLVSANSITIHPNAPNRNPGCPTQKPSATWSPKKASRHAHGHPPSPNKWGSGSSHPSKWSLHIHSRPSTIQCHRCHTDLLEWKAGRRPAHTSSLMCDVWCRVIITDDLWLFSGTVRTMAVVLHSHRLGVQPLFLASGFPHHPQVAIRLLTLAHSLPNTCFTHLGPIMISSPG